MLTKLLKKKLDGNYTRMLRAILNKSWRQHPTRHQLYGHLPPITKIIQVRRTRRAGHCWRSEDEHINDLLLWTPTYDQEKQDDQHEHTYSSYVRIRDVALKTCQKRWMIGRSGVRGSGISVLVARHDDDDDDDYIPWRKIYNEKNVYINKEHTVKNRKRKIIWFNPSFCRLASIIVGKYFLKLRDNHFNHNNILD